MLIEIKKFIKALLQPDVFATFVNYTVKIFLNPIIVLFVPVFLKENTQGYWYTFGSIAALTTFADLGFTAIMSQYAAHEYTYLTIDKENCFFKGEQTNIERMSSLFQFLVQWLRIVLLIAATVIFFAGVFMFSGGEDGVSWLIPWILYVIGTIINFTTQVELSFFEGCDQFAITQKVRTVASAVHCILTILLLMVGGGLYALAIPLFIKAMIVFLLMNRHFGGTLKQMLQTKSQKKIHWTKDFVPLLGRYAISWISGYFASQIYNPLVFSMYGSAAAGKVGYSLSIVQAIYSVANVWSLLAIPKYNMAVERREWEKMDRMLKRNLVYSLIVFALGIIALYTIGRFPLLAKVIWTRVMPETSVLVLAIAYMLSVIIYALAGYLRAHKREPFMIISILSGGIGAFLTFVFLKIFGLNYVFEGYLVAEIIVTPLGFWIWNNFRKKWHMQEVEKT